MRPIGRYGPFLYYFGHFIHNVENDDMRYWPTYFSQIGDKILIRLITLRPVSVNADNFQLFGEVGDGKITPLYTDNLKYF